LISEVWKKLKEKIQKGTGFLYWCSETEVVKNSNKNIFIIRQLERYEKFPDWPPGARTTNGTALCH
jgi:hypothetical protein